MVTVFLRGGLGNQMFQYATGFNLARKNGCVLVLDTTFLNDRFPRKEFTYRKFDLDIFCITPQFTLLSKISEIIPIPGLWLLLNLVLLKIKDIFSIQKQISERDKKKFDASVLQATGNINLMGYWQNELYFKESENALRDEFRFKYPIGSEAAKLERDMTSCNSVAVHVRRGDFIKYKSMRDIVGDTDLSYYGRAINYINGHTKNAKFFIFSDDIEWCRNYFKFDVPLEYISPESAGPKASYHLNLMSLAKHNIVTNSSFSWWGAWLNKNPQKIVLCPKSWYVSGTDNDLLPKGWISL